MTIRTRQYAKQQRTGLKRFRLHPNTIWIDAAEVSPVLIADQIVQHILRASDAAAAAES